MMRIKRDSKKIDLAQAIIDAYNLESVEDINGALALKDLFRSLFESMFQDKMNNHLGYESNDKGSKKQITEEIGILKRH